MDQRNAGASRTAIKADHGWHTYAEDHLALMDHLGMQQAVFVGLSMGGAVGQWIALNAPERRNAMSREMQEELIAFVPVLLLLCRQLGYSPLIAASIAMPDPDCWSGGINRVTDR